MPNCRLKCRNALPRTSGVYLLVDNLGEIVYIGRSDHIQRRWKRHPILPILELPEDNYSIYYHLTDPTKSNSQIEQYFIDEFKPKYNGKAHRRIMTITPKSIGKTKEYIIQDNDFYFNRVSRSPSVKILQLKNFQKSTWHYHFFFVLLSEQRNVKIRNQNNISRNRPKRKNLTLSSPKSTSLNLETMAGRSRNSLPNDEMIVKNIIKQALELPIITQADYNCHKCGTYVKIGQIHTCYRPVKLGRIWLTKDKENEKVKTYVNYAIKRY